MTQREDIEAEDTIIRRSMNEAPDERQAGLRPCEHPFDRQYRRDERIVCDACGHVEDRLTYSAPDERQAGLLEAVDTLDAAAFAWHGDHAPNESWMLCRERLCQRRLAAAKTLRAALAAQVPAQEERLDVERLQRAMKAHIDRTGAMRLGENCVPTCARDIAAEYRALTPDPQDDGGAVDDR